MPSLIAHLSRADQRELLDDLNYLNMAEIQAICDRYAIPYAIWVEAPDGTRQKTGERDRKGVVLDRVQQFLRTGKVARETCFPAAVVRFEMPAQELSASDRLFYGQHDKKNRQVEELLKSLTNDAFADGAIARILMREYWSAGKAPTFQEFAAAWLEARKEHTAPNPEWAFLTDRANKKAGADWKKVRERKAKKVMDVLRRIGRDRRT